MSKILKDCHLSFEKCSSDFRILELFDDRSIDKFDNDWWNKNPKKLVSIKIFPQQDLKNKYMYVCPEVWYNLPLFNQTLKSFKLWLLEDHIKHQRIQKHHDTFNKKHFFLVENRIVVLRLWSQLVLPLKILQDYLYVFWWDFFLLWSLSS